MGFGSCKHLGYSKFKTGSPGITWLNFCFVFPKKRET